MAAWQTLGLWIPALDLVVIWWVFKLVEETWIIGATGDVDTGMLDTSKWESKSVTSEGEGTG